jgi:4-diphosphocytidyl-2-C-methyl-D-erythritol kinase
LDRGALRAEDWMHARNDLESPAISLVPAIADVLAALRTCAEAKLARMSGSGATCFALFDTERACARAADALKADHPGWWVMASRLR